MNPPTSPARLLLAIALAASAAPARASDWPNYRGPNHDGTSPETNLPTHWKDAKDDRSGDPKPELKDDKKDAKNTDTPKLLWAIPMGAGFSSIAVEGYRAYCFGDFDDKETVVALDANTGAISWKTPIDKTIYDGGGERNGPRSTPTLTDGKVYVLGAYAKLVCMDALDGRKLWSHDFLKDYNGSLPSKNWGSAASPLILGDLLYACTGAKGKSLTAFNKNTGDIVWQTQDDQPTHSSPVPATIHGIPQIIFLTKTGLVSITPDKGTVLWRFPFPFQTATASAPVVGGKNGDIVYCSAAYKVGAAACRIEKSANGLSAKPLWRKENQLQQHWSSSVHKDGFLYGLFKPDNLGPASLRCIDIETGAVKWLEKGFSWQGATILAGDTLYVQDSTGMLALVRATPEKFDEINRFRTVSGMTWTMPTISNGRLYARSTAQAACHELLPRQQD